MHYHLIGISGSAMSGLAEILRAQGHEISGSDLKLGGHRVENITPDVDRVVFSPAITPSSDGWVELEAAKSQHIETLRYDELLGEITADAFLIAVTGTHGKSSTTSMIAHVLEEAGKNPTVLIGAPVPKWGGNNYRVGDPSFWVLEADDYDRKFLTLAPNIAVITSLEWEHVDVYENLEAVQETFKKFVLKTKEGGTVILWDHPNIDPIVKVERNDLKIIRYGENCELNPDLVPHLKVIGNHQRLNATAALGVCEAIGLSRESVIKFLADFSGTGRRLEYIGEKNGVVVYDDYGHHPTEVQVTLKAFKEAFPDRPRVVAFQPHQHSRVISLFDDFAKCFSDADRLLLLDVYSVPGRNEGAQVDAQSLVRAIRQEGVDVQYVGTIQNLGNILDQELHAGDAFLTMGATDITKVGREWIQRD